MKHKNSRLERKIHSDTIKRIPTLLRDIYNKHGIKIKQKKALRLHCHIYY
jgi:hypothetical protein